MAASRVKIVRCLVVFAHPDPASYNASVREAAEAGLRDGGNEVRVIDLYAEDFEACMSEAEHRAYLEIGQDHPDEQVRRHIEWLRWAEALVVIYPTWWSGQPAILKGWFERVFLPEVSFTLSPTGKGVRPALTNMRCLIGISTYGSPLWYRLLVGDPGRRTLTRTIRLAMGPRCRTTWLVLDRLDGRGNRDRRRFLDQVRKKMAAL